ncbi:MAG: MlaD family protein [Candidatus Gastranaerophilaceae bacterium]|jgi:ABC-type transporter Mla subunit MlaD
MVNEKKSKQNFRAGLFIIFSLGLFLFSVLWLRYFSIFPVMTIMAQFKNPGPLSTGVQVYYKGIVIGKIKKLEYTNDQKYTLVYLDITDKNLKMPDNSIAKIQVEGITGQKYIDIEPPYRPSSRFIANNSFIKGKSVFGITDFQYYLQEQVTSGRVNRILSNIEQTFVSSKKLSKNLEIITSVAADQKQDLKSIFKNGAKTAKNLANASEEVKKFSSNKQVWKDLEGSANNINATTKNLNKMSTDLEDAKIVQNIVTTIKQTNSTVSDVHQLIENMKKAGFNQDKINSILNNTDKTASNFSCMSSGINKMLAERFLLLKLLFGRPGKHLDSCKGKCP